MNNATGSNKTVVVQLKQDCPERTYTELKSTINEGGSSINMTMPKGFEDKNKGKVRSSTDKGTQKLTALFVIGIILALIGFTGMGFTPLGESVVGWGVLAGIGLFMVIAGILYVTVAVGRGHR